MIGELTNHVWQSTAFAAVAGLMTVVFRRNRAQVRYWLWLSASFKFLPPVLAVDEHRQSAVPWAPATQTIAATPAVAFTMVQMSQPFPNALTAALHSTETARDFAAISLFCVWAVRILGRSADPLSRLAPYSCRATLQYSG